MHKLPPASLYRLRILAAAGPRYYQVSAYMRRLETLGLVVATGQVEAAGGTQYRITEAGRVELAERYGPPPYPVPDP